MTRHGASDRWYKPAADSVLDIRCHTRAFTIVLILYRRMRNCQAVFFAPALELLAMIRDSFDTGQSENQIDLCQRMPFGPGQDRPWLVVDDLGTEQLTDWAAEVLFRVFNARYIARAHTLVVSNVRPDDISEPRLRSRFLDVAVCHVVPNSAGDYRQCRDRAEARQ